MQLMQACVKKSSRTTRPRSAASVRGPAVPMKPPEPSSSGARTRAVDTIGGQ